MRDSGLYKLLDSLLGQPLLWLLGLLKGQGRRVQSLQGAKLLVIKFSALGDSLLLLPYLKAAKAELGPDGRLEILCTPVNEALLQKMPFLDQVNVFRPREIFKAPWRVLILLGRFRRARFDLAIDFDQWLRSAALFGALSGAPWRVGFESAGQAKHFAFHATAKNDRASHEFEQFGELYALAGFNRSLVEPYEGFLRREGLLGAGASPVDLGALVLMHPGAGGQRGWQREWPWERFAAIGHWLRETQGLRLGLSGSGAEEGELCAKIESDLGGVELSCVNKDFATLVSSLLGAKLLICGNTGVMHLAVGLGTPVLALHGPTSSKKWGPLGAKAKVLEGKTACSPCLSLGFEYGCPQRPCMESISVAEAQAACQEMLR